MVHTPSLGPHSETNLVCPVLVGRDASLALALRVLDRARERQGGVVCVSGDAGIGKSRLTRAIVEHARTAGFVVLTGACFEADRAQPYSALLDMVRVLATTESPALAAHYFAPAAGALTTHFPELASVFGDVAGDDARDAVENRRRLLHAVSSAFQTLSRVQPVLLVVEDLHWSDDATLDLLLHLVQRVASSALAIVLTFRSDEIDARLARLLAELDRARCATDIPLRALDADATASMLQAIFRDRVAPGAPFVRSLHAMTEGNPFFIEEMLRALRVEEPESPTDSPWTVSALQRVRLPRTAIEAVVRRLASLSAPAQQLASVAAVAGRRFDFDLVHAITPHNEGALLQIVRELVDAQLVVEESADRFAFRHALTRDAIRSRLLGRERVAIHRAIAAALEARSDSRSHEADGPLAYHTFEAGMWDSARHYAIRAATNALALGAPREALLHYERAAAATERLGDELDPTLLLARGRVHETLGAFLHAQADFSAALDVARDALDQRSEWEALHALGLLWAARDYDRAGEYRRAALDTARALGDEDCVAQSLNRIGNWLVNAENPTAGIPYHEEALTIFTRRENPLGVAETVDLLAMSHHIAGDQLRAVELYERSIDQFTALENRRGLVNALAVSSACGPSYHASPGIVRSGPRSADVLGGRAARLAVEIEWRAGEAFAKYLLADTLGWRGDYAQALPLARESLAIAQELEHREWQCGANRVLGMVSLDLGAYDIALSHLEAAHVMACQLQSATWMRWTAGPFAIGLARSNRASDGRAVIARVEHDIAAAPSSSVTRTLGERWLTLVHAEIALATGRPEAALQCISEADAIGVPTGALARARACVSREDWDAATAALIVARAAAEEQAARSVLWRVAALEGTVHLGMRRRAEARAAFDAAREMAIQLADGIDDDALVETFRAEVDRLAPPPPPVTAKRAAKDAAAGLTRRERETVALVASGLSNRAIGRTLGIGERTVETHVAGALAKLGFSSRAQLAVWATAQGIVAPPARPKRPGH